MNMSIQKTKKTFETLPRTENVNDKVEIIVLNALGEQVDHFALDRLGDLLDVLRLHGRLQSGEQSAERERADERKIEWKRYTERESTDIQNG